MFGAMVAIDGEASLHTEGPEAAQLICIIGSTLLAMPVAEACSQVGDLRADEDDRRAAQRC